MATDTSQHFSPDYEGARAAFLVAAERRSARLGSYPLPLRSAAGGELCVDTAYLGPSSPARLLAVSSGLHGVEGFAGSALQHRLLVEQLDGLHLAHDCGLLLVHALNPYGFSTLRRVNESNVDLNRNFLRHPDDHVSNPDYDSLYDAINPERLDDDTDDASRARLLDFGQKNGIRRLQEVLTVGQYVHPEGVQFGGQRNESSNALLREIARRETRGAERIAWIDVHTGLGPFGEVEMILESEPTSPDFLRARAWWGDVVRSTVEGESLSAAVHGSIEVGLSAELEGRELTLAGAEFGTHDPVRVFWAMRADNWLHAHGDIDSEQGRAIKRELLEVFRPDDAAWEAKVLDVGAGLIARAAAGLAKSG